MSGLGMRLVVFAAALSLSSFAGAVELQCPHDKNFLTGCVEYSLGIGASNQAIGPNEDPLAAAKERTDQVKAGLLKELQGLVTGSTAGSAASSIDNFLSTVALTLPDLSNGVALTGQAEPSDDALNIEWTTPMCSKCLKLTLAIARKPSASAAILDSVAPADRDAAATALNQGLNSLDDYGVGLQYAYQGKLMGFQIGRSPDTYLGNIRVIHGLSLINSRSSQRTPQEFLEKLVADGVISRAQQATLIGKDGAFDRLPDQTRARISQEFATFFKDRAASIDPVADFVKAIDNQPQIILSASARQRDPRVGPNQRDIGLRVEIPMGASFNSLMDETASDCKDFNEFQIQNLYARGRTDPGVMNDLKALANACISHLSYAIHAAPPNAWRGAFSLNYKETDDQNYELANPAVNFSAPGSHSVIIAASVGRRFDASGSLGASHLDLALSHENVSDDPNRSNRTKITATWAFRVGQATVPISLVYANHPELDLTGANSQLSAHIGIKYNIDELGGG